MTTVTFLTEGKRIIGFDAKGHSGYAPPSRAPCVSWTRP